MPKKKPWQNSLCWKSRLTEFELLMLVHMWCDRRTATEAQKYLADENAQDADFKRRKPITRETIHGYFQDIGAYAWIVTGCGGLVQMMSERDNKPFDGRMAEEIKGLLQVLLEFLTRMFDTKSFDDERHKLFDQLEAQYPIVLLSEDFKACNGFSREWAHLYVGRAFSLGGRMDAGQDYGQAVGRLLKILSDNLERYPLRRPLPIDEFPWIEYWPTGYE
ncbi:MAG: hypothetical protein KZQ96_20990 [Candidatus Thiodiazotropha sp. (ex Lucinoma borealis)]|nr:hypothetical protein [Candidatus Thiodiazotropha sp. (ex Lucinoma borealis)]